MSLLEDARLRDKLDGVERRYEELGELLADPEILSKQTVFQKLAKEARDLEPLVDCYGRYRKLTAELLENEPLLRDSDPAMRGMAREESVRIEAERALLEQRIGLLLLPKDPNDERNVILEIRSGTGGEEAALFAADLLRMYLRFAERKHWQIDILSQSASTSGGIKEAVVLLAGQDVYSHLKWESGVHRVQRVPATEAQGRIHTSAATVAMLPEAEEVDIKVEDKDLRIDVMRAGGPGGQSVNTTDSAVRITHLPTGLIVVCMDEKSQHKNKAKAMKILRSRLLEIEQQKQDAERTEARRSQIKSGDRSEKIRTYNFPQDRLTDHRIGLTRHNLQSILDGDLDDIIDALRADYQAEALRGDGDDAVV
jgi:peptide chain release factor 1